MSVRSMMTRAIEALALAASLTACVQHTWAPGPDAQGTFSEQSAKCRLLARGAQTGFVAYGSVAYVAGAALGNAIGNAVRAQANFNDCLEATGWIPVQ